MKVGCGPSPSLRVRDGPSSHTHLFVRSDKQELSCTVQAFYRLTCIDKACLRGRSEPSATAGKTDLAGVARSCGIEHATTVRDLESFKREATKALEENVLRFVVCKVDQTTGHRQIQRPNEDLWEHKYRFVRYLERTEGKEIFKGRG